MIDLNLETVSALAGEGRLALYGDASHPDILKKAGIARASHLVDHAAALPRTAAR